jgi:hypothetical protein
MYYCDDKKLKRKIIKWAYAHGYYGTAGGWIYKEGDTRLRTSGKRKNKATKPICQGWENFYKIYRYRIDKEIG